NHGTVWAIAFAPSGKQVAYGAEDGSVWVWDLGGKAAPRRLGFHDGEGLNYVRLVKYTGDGQLLTVAENGQAVRWQNFGAGEKPVKKELFRFEAPKLYRVALSPDGQWLAGTSDAAGFRFTEVRSLDGRQQKKFRLP